MAAESLPGSVLDLSKLSSYRVDELKFWLKCRGDSLKKLPTKSSCINEYVTNGNTAVVFNLYEENLLVYSPTNEKNEKDSGAVGAPVQDKSPSKPFIQGNLSIG